MILKKGKYMINTVSRLLDLVVQALVLVVLAVLEVLEASLGVRADSPEDMRSVMRMLSIFFHNSLAAVPHSVVLMTVASVSLVIHLAAVLVWEVCMVVWEVCLEEWEECMAAWEVCLAALDQHQALPLIQRKKQFKLIYQLV